MSETTTSKTQQQHRPLSSERFPGSNATVPPSPSRHRPRSATLPLVDTPGSRRKLQDARSVLRSTTESVLAPTDTESPTWHTIPLAFAVLPAIGGVLFTGGSYFITDVMLLFLIAVFLHWLVKFPWEWYHSSQSIPRTPDITPVLGSPSPTAPRNPAHDAIIRDAAARELRFNERAALLCCFIGPLLGGWLLHAIRSQLSRPSEGLVSNFNLVAFVLAAELRPVAQVVKLIRSRSLYLQCLVHHPPAARVDLLAERLEKLQVEVRELTLLTSRAIERDPDLDALNRAVRRYEKKEALHSLHTENRILEIDNRLNDILTLAAAASVRQKEMTLTVMLLEWVCALFVIPFSLVWKVINLPARAVETLVGLRKSQLLLRGGTGGSMKGQQRLKGSGRMGGAGSGRGDV